MIAEEVLRQTAEAGVKLSLSDAGRLKATGNSAAVNRWLAVLREHKAEIIDALKAGPGETATASRWLIHFTNRKPLEVAFWPASRHTEVLDQYPEALAAETIEATFRSPASSMTADEERAVLRWLDHIGETDPATIAEVLTDCRRDEEARRYFVARAAEVISAQGRRRRSGAILAPPESWLT